MTLSKAVDDLQRLGMERSQIESRRDENFT